MSSPSSAPSIVPATPNDRLPLITLLDTTGLPHDDLSDRKLSHVRVLRLRGVVQGVVGLEPAGRSALLRSLAVHPSARGSGYGTALMQAAEAHGRSLGMDALYLLTTTAAAFFQQRGYKPIPRDEAPSAIARTDEFARLCPSTATCMQKSLIS